MNIQAIKRTVKSGAQYLDQPALIENLYAKAPWILSAAGMGYVGYATATAPANENKKAFVKSSLVTGSAIASALVATKYFGERPEFVKEGLAKALYVVRSTLSKTAISPKLNELLNDVASKEKISAKQIYHLRAELKKISPNLGDHMLDLIIPPPGKELTNSDKSKIKEVLSKLNPHLHSSVVKTYLEDKLTPSEKHFLEQGILKSALHLNKSELHQFINHKEEKKSTFKELIDLSLLGLSPIVGAITGGAVANKLNGKNWKTELKAQAKEGSYQYLSNIFLCNIGAGLFGWGAEKAGAGRNTKLGVMLAGIGIIGVWAGSAIANVIGNNFINPACDKGCGHAWQNLSQNLSQNGIKGLFKDLYGERRPEVVDVLTHMDDLAMVGMLAGFKWILPGLSFLYTFSGARAGIGYRNVPPKVVSSDNTSAISNAQDNSALPMGNIAAFSASSFAQRPFIAPVNQPFARSAQRMYA